MTLTIHTVLLLLAALCFFLAALDYQPPRGNLVAGGLFLLTLAFIF